MADDRGHRKKRVVRSQTAHRQPDGREDAATPLGGAHPTPNLDDVLAANRRHAAQASVYAEQAIAAAVAACADVLAMRLPATSQAAAYRAYERQLGRDFRLAYERLMEAWSPKDGT